MPAKSGSARSERLAREHATARASILAAARRLAEREGSNGLSLRAVAAEAGYAPAALYGYFRNRSELVLALAAEDMAGLARAMREASKANRDGDGLGSVAAAALAHLCTAETMAAAAIELGRTESGSEAERLFNGRLISALRALSDAAGGRSESRDGQRDVVLMAATLAGLALLSRSGRLQTLGFEPEELVARLDKRFAVET